MPPPSLYLLPNLRSLSIVIACLNNRAGLGRTLDSLAAQRFRDFELIVVDGGSSDGSLELLQARRGEIAHLRSGPDGGVYDAQNRGAALADGNYLLFLNAGDWLADEHALSHALAGPPGEDLVYGDVVLLKNGQPIPTRMPPRLSFEYLMRSTLCTQALYYRRQTFLQLGGYDTSLRVCADYDLLLRAVLVHQASSRHVARRLVYYPVDGLSSRPENLELARQERADIQARHVPAQLRDSHAAWLLARQRSLTGRIRSAARPLARSLRRAVRQLRGRSDPGP
jgi:glycosyltransferase involved in cell wall biosynthesis